MTKQKQTKPRAAAPTLPTDAIAIITEHFKGKRREMFVESITVIQDGLANGAWLPKRGNPQAYKGLNKGLTGSREILRSVDPHHNRRIGDPRREGTSFDLYMLLAYGQPIDAQDVKARNAESRPEQAESPWTPDGKILPVKGLDATVVQAWNDVCTAARAAITWLDAARPKPVITKVGLSPKVTKTLTEMNLDIDLPTITPAEIETFEAQATDDETGEPKVDDYGNPVMELRYRVKWSEGVQLGMSRFHSGCQACGKPIPSRLFVPIEAKCKRNGLIGLWIGCDCARNIFGVKDDGINPNAK